MSDNMPKPVKKQIEYDDLQKVDIRVGTILEVIDIEKSDTLLALIVSFGDHTRRIVVGMKKERENPKEIEGLQALFVLNLKPRRIMGELSEGMLYDLGYADNITPVLAVPEKSVPDGTRAG